MNPINSHVTLGKITIYNSASGTRVNRRWALLLFVNNNIRSIRHILQSAIIFAVSGTHVAIVITKSKIVRHACMVLPSSRRGNVQSRQMSSDIIKTLQYLIIIITKQWGNYRERATWLHGWRGKNAVQFCLNLDCLDEILEELIKVNGWL